MKLTSIFFLSAFAALGMTSCVVPGDVGYGPGYGSGSVSYRQYNSLPTGYVGAQSMGCVVDGGALGRVQVCGIDHTGLEKLTLR